jgi:hypothetical protein
MPVSLHHDLLTQIRACGVVGLRITPARVVAWFECTPDEARKMSRKLHREGWLSQGCVVKLPTAADLWGARSGNWETIATYTNFPRQFARMGHIAG